MGGCTPGGGNGAFRSPDGEGDRGMAEESPEARWGRRAENDGGGAWPGVGSLHSQALPQGLRRGPARLRLPAVT